MDDSVEAMDISPVTAKPTLVRLPPQPLSPWLRYAHGHNIGHAEASPIAHLRALLDYELVLQTSGSSWIWSEAHAGSISVPAGSLAFIPPDFVHAWGYDAGTHLAIHFDLHAKPAIEVPENIHIFSRSVTRSPIATMPRFSIGRPADQRPLLVPLVTPLASLAEVRQPLDALVDLWSRRGQAGAVDDLEAANILTGLLTVLDEPGGPETPPTDPRILTVLRWLHEPENTGLRRVTVAELARLACMGDSAFRAAFVQVTDETPRRYLENLRIERAARMLLDGDSPISAVARAVGYDDPYHFSRVFKRVKGRPPSEFRRLARRAPHFTAPLVRPRARSR